MPKVILHAVARGINAFSLGVVCVGSDDLKKAKSRILQVFKRGHNGRASPAISDALRTARPNAKKTVSAATSIPAKRVTFQGTAPNKPAGGSDGKGTYRARGATGSKSTIEMLPPKSKDKTEGTILDGSGKDTASEVSSNPIGPSTVADVPGTAAHLKVLMAAMATFVSVLESESATMDRSGSDAASEASIDPLGSKERALMGCEPAPKGIANAPGEARQLLLKASEDATKIGSHPDAAAELISLNGLLMEDLKKFEPSEIEFDGDHIRAMAEAATTGRIDMYCAAAAAMSASVRAPQEPGQ